MTLGNWLKSINKTEVYVSDGNGGAVGEPTDQWLESYLGSEIEVEWETENETVVHVPDMECCDHSRLRLDETSTYSALYLI